MGTIYQQQGKKRGIRRADRPMPVGSLKVPLCKFCSYRLAGSEG